MPLPMRCSASATSSLMPGSVRSSERVLISPITQGIFTAKCVLRSATSGQPNAVKDAGAGSVFPHRLDGGELHLLVFRHGVARFIAEHDHAQRRCQPEARRDRHRALGEVDVAAAQQYHALIDSTNIAPTT